MARFAATEAVTEKVFISTECGDIASNGAHVANVVAVKGEKNGHHARIGGSNGNTIVAVGEPLPKQALDTAADPTEIAHQSFDTERRGFDQHQVQQYLRAVADSLHDAQKRETEMRTRLGRAVRRAEAAEQALRDAPTHDAAELNREFADQVASILEEARLTSEQRVAAAEKSADQLMTAARADAATLRNEAKALLQQRCDEAEVAATEIVIEGQAEAKAIQEQAILDAEALLVQAADRVERACAEGDALIREAEEARAQILEDMERRRRQARAQVERLRVGRDRLLRSYEVVRRTLEETTVELKSSLGEAKVRGDGAERAVAAEPLASREQLEAELRDAKMIGRITISDPVPPPSERVSAAKPLRSPALPRPLQPPTEAQPSGRQTDQPTSTTPEDSSVAGRPRVTEAMKKGASTKATSKHPKAPAVAPTLTASTHTEAPQDPIAAMMAAAEAKQAGTAAPVSASLASAEADDLAPLDAELAGLEDHNLNVVEPCDEIEEVVAMPAPDASKKDPAAPGLFAALRAQRSGKKKAPTMKVVLPDTATIKDRAAKNSAAKDAAEKSGTPKAAHEAVVDKTAASDIKATSRPDEDQGRGAARRDLIPGIEAQRDAVIADAAKQLEKRLKRALADEQNELLAGIRAAKKNVALTAIVGDIDAHLNRYVVAIHEVAAVTYGAGAALIDAQAVEGRLPAGAVEELLETDVISPIRQRLESLDDLKVDAADLHVDPVRAFYRQRKTDHLGDAASRLANLLCVAGVCDALPRESALPWATTTK